MAEGSNLPSMYADLNKFIHISDYKQALKVANKIIHSRDGKQEIQAMHCKTVCLIQMNQFAEALKFIQSTEEIQPHIAFEKAYCQYRLLQTNEALETITDQVETDIRLLELKAQVLYRLGRYSECLPIYKQLMKECADDYEVERLTNFSAVYSALAAFEGNVVHMGFELSSYDQLYNKSCWLLGQGKVKEAESVLEKAEEECRSLFADDPDATEEEVECEVAVIKVQLGFVHQLLGNEERALALYNQVIKSRPTDVALVAVASNNIITINKDQNVFDSRKKMKALSTPGLEKKLVPFQRKKIDFNRALLFMYSNQWDACRKLLRVMHQDYQDSDIPCLIQAAQICREKGIPKAIEYLKEFIVNHSDPDIPTDIDLTNIKLTLVQMLLQQGDIEQTCQLLESMEEICYQPAMVSLLVSLYKSQVNGVRSALDLFHRAVDHHKANETSPDILHNLMWKSAQFCLKHNQPEDAAMVLENMLTLQPGDVKVLAQMIFAYAQFNPKKANERSKNLPSLDELSLKVNVDELEREASRFALRYVKRQKDKKDSADAVNKEESTKQNVVSEGNTAILVKTKKKKKKKNPVPKNFIPNFEPDPERWMPLKDRSYYKGRRKDRKNRDKIGKGSQGTSSAASEVYDMSKSSTKAGTSKDSPRPSSSKSSDNTPVNSPKPSSNKSGGGSSKNKKKKKKGKGGW